MQNKNCSKCGVNKPLDAFYLGGWKGSVKAQCKECTNTQMFHYSRARYATINGRAQQMYNSAKCRAKKYNLEFTLCFEYLHILVAIGKCAKSGLTLDMSPPVKGQTNPLSPSLDRKQSHIGYTNTNVQVVANMYNMGKSDHDELDFIAMCIAVADRYRNDPGVVARLNELRNAKL